MMRRRYSPAIAVAACAAATGFGHAVAIGQGLLDASQRCGDACIQARRQASGAKGFPDSGPPERHERAAGAGAAQLDAQFEALRSIEDGQVTYDARGVPIYIKGSSAFGLPHDLQLPRDNAALERALLSLKRALLAEGSETLMVVKSKVKPNGGGTIVLSESIRGIPVWGSRVTINTWGSQKPFIQIDCSFLPDRGLIEGPVLLADDAAGRAAEWLAEQARLAASVPSRRNPSNETRPHDAAEVRLESLQTLGSPRLHYLLSDSDTALAGRLVWVVELGSDGLVVKRVFVDAANGSVVSAIDAVAEIASRSVFDSNYTTTTPGTLIFADPGWSTDVAATTAYTNVGLAHAALAPVSSDPGMDGTPYRISIRFGTGWSSFSQLITSGTWHQDVRLSGGQPSNPYRPWTDSAFTLDVTAHEVGHIALFWNSGLPNCTVACEESGAALAEGYADYSAIKADMASQLPSPWIMGDIFPDGLGFRSAEAPLLSNLNSRDYWPQRSLWLTGEGGAHDNATILTHAYYLLVNGGYHYRAGIGGVPSILVPAIGRTKAEAVFMQLLVNESMGSSQTFQQTRQETRDAALQLFGTAERDAVLSAWDAVGVTPCSNPPPTPSLYGEAMCPWWRIITPPVVGGTTYNMQYSLTPNFSTTATWYSGDYETCELSVSIWTYFRARACNACGCSPGAKTS